MQATIHKVLQALNEIDLRGERNHDLLLYAIQQLKPLQTAILAPLAKEQPTEGAEA